MNNGTLKGILKNIEYSHTIHSVEFYKADLLVPRKNGTEDLINIRFKRFSNPYKENQLVTLTGNLRSYSSKLPEGKNKVDLYVFTYFDSPELLADDTEIEEVNSFELDGRICKIEDLRITKSGKCNIHLILANNLIVSNGTKKLNSYIPCIAWGKEAQELSKLSVNTKLKLKGELHSREYIKRFDEQRVEIKVAHEFLIKEFEII